MRAVEHGANAIKGDPYPRTFAFADLAATSGKQRFNVAPVNIGADRIGEDSLQRGKMLFIQVGIVSQISITANQSGVDTNSV